MFIKYFYKCKAQDLNKSQAEDYPRFLSIAGFQTVKSLKTGIETMRWWRVGADFTKSRRWHKTGVWLKGLVNLRWLDVWSQLRIWFGRSIAGVRWYIALIATVESSRISRWTWHS